MRIYYQPILDVKLKEINPNYKIYRIDSTYSNDALVAEL